MQQTLFCSYNDCSVEYNPESGTFCVHYATVKQAVKDCSMQFTAKDGSSFTVQDFQNTTHEHLFEVDSNVLACTYTGGPAACPELKLRFCADWSGIMVSAEGKTPLEVSFSGSLYWGKDGYAARMDGSRQEIRASIGPAARPGDNLLFDRKTDSALRVESQSVRLYYDWANKQYIFTAQGTTKFSVLYKIIQSQYHCDYAPINKKSTFSKPPAGWMTWYAVKFDACEKAVLDNAKWQSENLKKFGADTVWVDWEWYHKDFEGERHDGANTFCPDKQKYPHGLKYVADKIKEDGLVPALWIGYTNDPDHNKYTKDNPEIILAEENTWCGRYHYDFSHPKYLEEFLPLAMQQVFDWGYQAVKFDTLPDAWRAQERYHEHMHDPKLTTKEAYRGLIKKARKLLGKHTYMLSCAGLSNADILWAVDLFDAARVGGDIFEWDCYIKEGINRVKLFWPLHNNVLYADPDNLVIREEFNTYTQAASRAFFSALLGLPLTLGDNLPDLPEQRVELLRRCLPVMDVHPVDLARCGETDGLLTIKLAIALPFESYLVADVFNISDTPAETEISRESLELEQDRYFVYDYTKDELLGILADQPIKLHLEANESRILSIRKMTGRPQIISTSRHVTQGAAELRSMNWSEEKQALSFSAELVEGDPYTVTLHIPPQYTPAKGNTTDILPVSETIYQVRVLPEQSGKHNFRLKFTKK